MHYGPVEEECRSEYAHLRIRKKGTTVSLFSVPENGDPVVESRLDIERPHLLTHDYLRCMFFSYLIRPRQERVAIIGLGGGAMVHFLRRYDPDVRIDAIEIDPVMVRIAQTHFNVRGGEKINVVTADGLEFLSHTESRYDTIYLDAFLRVSENTDDAGVPRDMRTLRFYRQAQEKLKPGGLMVFNLNPHDSLQDDVETLREAFAWIRGFPLGKEQGMVVLASSLDYTATNLPAAAREIDRRFQAGFSFEELLQRWG